MFTFVQPDQIVTSEEYLNVNSCYPLAFTKQDSDYLW